ncbi:MAG: tyrosine-type recombinase/integrase [Lachnospiraceae bacterium]|jgi:integrase/recombinase XerD|nr:tyrosine-type recombinase/integrase [Lachnospiraceae bacterium]
MKNTKDYLKKFENYLYEKEKHPRTITKYLHDVGFFLEFIQGQMQEKKLSENDRQQEKRRGGRKQWQLKGINEIDREWIFKYKEYLIKNYKPASVNSMLVALNSYLEFSGNRDYRVQLCRIQKQIFREEEKELSMEEYQRLVKQAEKNGNLRMSCILQTIGSTGIRIGELPYITVETLTKKLVYIQFKGKCRCVILPNSLVALLEQYCERNHIREGSIFITKGGNPVDRRNIWSDMKRLCRETGVSESKGFPHNLRHLFACCYYEKEKDIIRLADYLGHSNVETTRRYTMISNMEACRGQLELGMLVGEWFAGENVKRISESEKVT